MGCPSARNGQLWRQILGGAPRITGADSIIQVLDEPTCREIATIVNAEVLGWKVGPPPVVILRVRDHLIAYPSNVPRGEWGIAVGMNLRKEILGVSTW